VPLYLYALINGCFLQIVPNLLEQGIQLLKLYLTIKCMAQKEDFYVRVGVTYSMTMEQNVCQTSPIAILMHPGLDNTALSVGRV